MGKLTEVPDALARHVRAIAGQNRAVIQTHLTGIETGVNNLWVVWVEARNQIIRNGYRSCIVRGELGGELLQEWQG